MQIYSGVFAFDKLTSKMRNILTPLEYALVFRPNVLHSNIFVVLSSQILIR